MKRLSLVFLLALLGCGTAKKITEESFFDSKVNAQQAAIEKAGPAPKGGSKPWMPVALYMDSYDGAAMDTAAFEWQVRYLGHLLDENKRLKPPPDLEAYHGGKLRSFQASVDILSEALVECISPGNMIDGKHPKMQNLRKRWLSETQTMNADPAEKRYAEFINKRAAQ